MFTPIAAATLTPPLDVSAVGVAAASLVPLVPLSVAFLSAWVRSAPIFLSTPLSSGVSPSSSAPAALALAPLNWLPPNAPQT